MIAPAFFQHGSYALNRITAQDLGFARALMTDAAMHTHRPDPTPPSEAEVSRQHLADLTHWQTFGLGRYLAFFDGRPIGLCGLTRRDGMAGLNLSYHLLPDHWGQGHASALVRGLILVAQDMASEDLYGLVRPANPASARVLEKAGFTRAETLMLGGAPTIRYTRAAPI